jgi:hypothetical protein
MGSTGVSEGWASGPVLLSVGFPLAWPGCGAGRGARCGSGELEVRIRKRCPGVVSTSDWRRRSTGAVAQWPAIAIALVPRGYANGQSAGPAGLRAGRRGGDAVDELPVLSATCRVPDAWHGLGEVLASESGRADGEPARGPCGWWCDVCACSRRPSH